jgi:hypothetical protein
LWLLLIWFSPTHLCLFHHRWVDITWGMLWSGNWVKWQVVLIIRDSSFLRQDSANTWYASKARYRDHFLTVNSTEAQLNLIQFIRCNACDRACYSLYWLVVVTPLVMLWSGKWERNPGQS